VTNGPRADVTSTKNKKKKRKEREKGSESKLSIYLKDSKENTNRKAFGWALTGFQIQHLQLCQVLVFR